MSDNSSFKSQKSKFKTSLRNYNRSKADANPYQWRIKGVEYA